MGMSYQEKKAAEGVPPAVIFGMSLFFVFLILGGAIRELVVALQRSAGDPIAVFGAFWFLWMRGLDNNVYAQIGLVMLIGLAAKNAILIVEFAKMEFDKGKSAEEAALIAAKLRLRPILMTAFAFILGCVPLWTASGAGAISRRVLGTAVIGGMLAASVLAIFLIPEFDVVERFSHRKKRLLLQPQHRPSCQRKGISHDPEALGYRNRVSVLTGCAVGPKYKRPPVTCSRYLRGAPPEAGTPVRALDRRRKMVDGIPGRAIARD